jgi:hypothetical protein
MDAHVDANAIIVSGHVITDDRERLELGVPVGDGTLLAWMGEAGHELLTSLPRLTEPPPPSTTWRIRAVDLRPDAVAVICDRALR